MILSTRSLTILYVHEILSRPPRNARICRAWQLACILVLGATFSAASALAQVGNAPLDLSDSVLPQLQGRGEALPAPPQPQNSARRRAGETETIEVAPRAGGGAEAVQLERKDSELFSLAATEADLAAVLQMIAEYHSLNLVLGPEVHGPVTVSFNAARLDEILDAILSVSGFTWHRHGNLLYVTRLDRQSTANAQAQGRVVRVFPLDYIAATEAERVVTGLLSPVGQVFVSESSDTDQSRTQELLVVEDIEQSVRRIESYMAQVDVPPRQVLIEAHVLQVTLDDEQRHGINLKALAKAAGGSISLSTVGLADPAATPASFFQVDGTDVQGVLELIKTHSYAETLASPKVMVVNRQEAKIQIGSQLGYFVTTTTQTSTLQSVEFLDVGVVLTVTPVISADGNVLLTVNPKVSGGRINPDTKLPEEDTTEVSSAVLLPDGGGLVIGGLIKETLAENDTRVPVLSSLPAVGKLFTKRTHSLRRDEIIIALIARVISNAQCGIRPVEARELERALPPSAKETLWQPGGQSWETLTHSFSDTP